MDKRYIDKVIEEMSPFLTEQGFSLKDNVFLNETKAFKIDYNEEKQLFILSYAEVEGKTVGEFSQLDAWLFDDSQNLKDAESVGIDFTATIKKELGIKSKRSSAGIDVELPTMNKSGSITASGFTKKLLDIFPALKDEYKLHVAENGAFLYLNFFGEKVVPLLSIAFEENEKKQVKKLKDLFEDVYIHADKEAVNAAIALLCAAAYKNETANKNIREMLKENTHFQTAFENFLLEFKRSKKMKTALIK